MQQYPKNKPPYRILYVENGIGYGGAIICLRHLVRNLDRSSFTPMLITGRSGPHYREITSECLWKHIPDHRIDVERIRKFFDRFSQTKQLENMHGLVNQICARIDDLCNFLPFFIQLARLTRSFQPALIHVNNEPLCNRAAILVGKALKIPVICHVRGNQQGSKMMYWLYRLPDHFIPVSNWISQGIGRLGVSIEKRSVVYDGIDLKALNINADGRAFRSIFGIPQDAFTVGLPGLLIPWKGQSLLLDTAQELKKQIPNLRLLIIGGTPEDHIDYERQLTERVRQEALTDTVTFTGHVTDMPAAYNSLDVVVSASTSPEPLGTMVIECMAMGRPLVAPNHGGAAEMAEHDRTALLFDPGNCEQLTRCIRRLYHDPDLRERLGPAARTKALAAFSVSQHVRNVQAIYAKVLRRKSYF